MLPDKVLDKLQYFDKDKYELADEEITLTEKEKSGRVQLQCKLNNQTLVFSAPAENVLPYLDGDKKYATSCPDDFLFELLEDGTWALHIMEYKRKITTSTIKKSKIQFVMGIYNARAIAGFLNIVISKIYVYSAYRREFLDQASLIELRAGITDEKNRGLINDWEKGRCTLCVDMEEVIFDITKIRLDQDGNGSCELRR